MEHAAQSTRPRGRCDRLARPSGGQDLRLDASAGPGLPLLGDPVHRGSRSARTDPPGAHGTGTSSASAVTARRPRMARCASSTRSRRSPPPGSKRCGCAPLNEALPGDGFRRDFRDGEITFRPCLHLGDGPLAPESGRSAPALVGCAVDHALPPRAAVALGRCTDAEFLARQNTQDGGNGFPFAFELRFTRWVGACLPAMATS